MLWNFVSPLQNSELQLHTQDSLSIGHTANLADVHNRPIEVGYAFHVCYGDEVPFAVHRDYFTNPPDLLQSIVNRFLSARLDIDHHKSLQLDHLGSSFLENFFWISLKYISLMIYFL